MEEDRVRVDETPLNAMAFTVQVDSGEFVVGLDRTKCVVISGVYIDSDELPDEGYTRTLRFLNLALDEGSARDVAYKMLEQLGEEVWG